MKGVILIGGGGHALSLLEMLGDLTRAIGYADVKENPAMPILYLGTDEDILREYPPEDYRIHHAVVYTDKVDLGVRKRLVHKFGRYEGETFVAPTAVISHNSLLGSGTAVFHRCVINKSSIGAHCIINTGAIIEHGCELGENVIVAPEAVVCGGVRIGSNVFVGAGSIIRDDVRITGDVIIGMGSLVTKNITEPGIYYGSPIYRRN